MAIDVYEIIIDNPQIEADTDECDKCHINGIHSKLCSYCKSGIYYELVDRSINIWKQMKISEKYEVKFNIIRSIKESRKDMIQSELPEDLFKI